MTEVISLKKAEQKVFSIATQDGLLDIFLGFIFLMFVVVLFLSRSLGDFWSSMVLVPVWGILMLGIRLIRRKVIRPRVGVVEFGVARKVRLRRFTSLMILGNVIAFILGLWVFFNAGEISGREISVLMGLSCLMLASIAAYFLDFRRLYIYGLLVGISPPVGEWLYANHGASHHGFPITFGITAAVMICTGLFVFIRLLRDNPIPIEGDTSKETPDDHATV